MIFKLSLVVAFVSAIIFLSYIYPNLKKPLWQRKLVSAGYLRLRGHGDLADGVLIKAVEKEPKAEKLYIDLFENYSTPHDMQKLYSIISKGAELTKSPGVMAAEGWCLMEEGEFDRAEKIFSDEEVYEYMKDHNLIYLAKLYFKKEDYAACEKEFIRFYETLYSSLTGGKPAGEKQFLSDLSPEEVILLAAARKKQGKGWRETASVIPKTSIHEEDCWEAFYSRKSELYKNLKVETGIYGPPEQLLSLRRKELSDMIETAGEYLGIK